MVSKSDGVQTRTTIHPNFQLAVFWSSFLYKLCTIASVFFQVTPKHQHPARHHVRVLQELPHGSSVKWALAFHHLQSYFHASKKTPGLLTYYCESQPSNTCSAGDQVGRSEGLGSFSQMEGQMEIWFCFHQSVLRCSSSFPAEIPEGLYVWVWLAPIKHILEKKVECSLHACASSHTLLLC